uniref:Uncharacterized protein n=1 Tax=Knipowitschia caucasica TaxID=637954 RepID=A0AAV2JVD9_KNICA
MPRYGDLAAIQPERSPDRLRSVTPNVYRPIPVIVSGKGEQRPCGRCKGSLEVRLHESDKMHFLPAVTEQLCGPEITDSFTLHHGLEALATHYYESNLIIASFHVLYFLSPSCGGDDDITKEEEAAHTWSMTSLLRAQR